jgi:hypothetical protein
MSWALQPNGCEAKEGFVMRALTACILFLVIAYSALAQSTPNVWVYRPDTDNSGLPLTLYIDGHKLATMAKGQFFGVQVPVGEHAFSWTSAPRAVPVVVPIGAEAYLEVRFESAQPFLAVTRQPVEKAIAAMNDLRPVDADSVFDFGVIVPAQTFTAPAKPAPAAVVNAPQPRPVRPAVEKHSVSPSPAPDPLVPQPIVSANAPAAKLADIHKIYIDDLGKQEGADLVREKIQLRLTQDGHFMVVEKPELADAVLTGEAGVKRGRSTSSYGDANGLFSSGSTSSRPHGVLHLVDTQTNETVWTFEYKQGLFAIRGSASGRIADQVVDKLIKDATAQAKKK